MSSAKRKADDMATTAAAAAAAAAAASAVKSNNDATSLSSSPPSESLLVKHHAEMMEACSSGQLATVLSLLEAADADDDAKKGSRDDVRNNNNDNDHDHHLSQKHLLAAQQDPTTGLSPLMLASQNGHIDICQALLDAGAPWNAVDRCGKCAGDYATGGEKWDVVNLLVEVGTKAELILGASIRLAKQLDGSKNGDGKEASVTTKSSGGALNLKQRHGEHDHDETQTSKNDANSNATSTKTTTSTTTMPVSHEPCTKPDYLHHTNVRYNAANTLLLDNDDDAVMMEWERPLMNAHANILTHNGTHKKRVLNIGFGLGIIDTALQSYEPALHVIIEAHPTVYEKMVKDGWDAKPNVRICFGRWQDELPKLVEEGGLEFDGIFYDTYGEHFTDLEDFHEIMAKVLCKTDGIYSFFNGLAPDNLFFHGVACNCVKIQLSHLGLDTEFAQCEIQVDEKDWEGVRRKYWHGRDTYYLPIATWKKKD